MRTTRYKRDFAKFYQICAELSPGKSIKMNFLGKKGEYYTDFSNKNAIFI